MWRSRLIIPKCKFFMKPSHKNKLNFSSYFKENSKNMTFKIITSSGLAFVGAIVYVLHEPKLKHYVEKNIPYIDHLLNKLFLDNSAKQYSRIDEIYFTEKLLNNNSGRKDNDSRRLSEDNKHINEKIIQSRETENNLKPPEIEKCIASLEETILKLKKNLVEAISVCRLAASVIEFYDEELNEVVDFDFDKIPWKEVNNIKIVKDKILNFARVKIVEVKKGFEKLKSSSKRLSKLGVINSLTENGEKVASVCLLEFEKAEDKLNTTNEEAKEVAKFRKVLEISKELCERELDIILPNKLSVENNLLNTLNLFIINANNRIEQLKKQVASQEAEKNVNIKSVLHQKMLDEFLSDAEKQGHFFELNNILEKLFVLMKEEFEIELHQLLVRQVSAHADHLQKSLELQEQELNKKYKLELEEKILNQKDALVSETNQNSARLLEIVEYLQTMNELNKSTEKMQTLWLICQAIGQKITSAENLNPFAYDIDKIKILFGEDDFVHTIIASIPDVALNRGVFNSEVLKQRFEKVKYNCQKVALIDAKNDSLYRYFLSYLQSLLLIDVALVREIDDNIHADISKLDTDDILQGITYFLKTGNLEQSLRYANQLKGEPKAVAEDWIKELTYLLETQLALKALIAYAAASSVQAYH